MTKKQSVNMSDKAYKPNPKFTIAILEDKGFGELLKWLKQISRFSRVQDFLYVSDYKEKTLKLEIFSKEYRYCFSARLPGNKYVCEKCGQRHSHKEIEEEPFKVAIQCDQCGGACYLDDGYLGCIAQTRKPRAGETWNRGRDLPDGSYSEKTWQRIKNDIFAFELVKVVRNSPDKRECEKTIDK